MSRNEPKVRKANSDAGGGPITKAAGRFVKHRGPTQTTSRTRTDATCDLLLGLLKFSISPQTLNPKPLKFQSLKFSISPKP